MMMKTLKSCSRFAIQLLNRHSFNFRRAISIVPPSFLNRQPLLSPRRHTLLPSSSVNAVCHLHTGRDFSGGFEEMYENQAPMGLGILMIVPEGEAYVIERYGEYVKTLTEGTHLFNPNVDQIAYVHSLKEGPLSIPPHIAITGDFVFVYVDGVISVKIVDPELASYAVEKPKDELFELARNAAQSEVGKITKEKLMAERSTLNDNIANSINKTVKDWGLQCTGYESNYKILSLPQEEKVTAAKPGISIAKEEWIPNIFASEGAKILVNDATLVTPILKEDWMSLLNMWADENLHLLSVEEGFAKLEQILKVERERLENKLASKVGDSDLSKGDKARVIAEGIIAQVMSTVSEEMRKLKEQGGIRDISNPPPMNWGIQTERRRAANDVEVVPEMKAFVVERSGKYLKTLTAGTHLLDPAIDQITYEYSLKETVISIPFQNLITSDGVTVSFNVDLLVKVFDPKLASYTVANPVNELIETAKSTVEKELSRCSIDEFYCEEWDELMVETLQQVANDWGLYCVSYEKNDLSCRGQQEVEIEQETVEH